MKTASSRQQLAEVFRRAPVAEMTALERAVPERSRRSLFRDLSALGYLASYSHAGRYYTLLNIPSFDDQGLWHWREIGFSRHGRLKATVQHLVEVAEEGATQRELQGRLRVRVHNTLLELVRHQRLGRQPFEGQYLYVSADQARASGQLTQRWHMADAARKRPLSPSTVIEVLFEVIQSNKARGNPATIAARLNAREVAVTVEQVEELFHRHGIEKKTGRSRFPCSRR